MAIRTGDKEIELRWQPAGQLMLSSAELALTCRPGESCEGEVTVRAPEGTRLIGYAFTDSQRLRAIPPEFTANVVRLKVQVLTEGLSANARVQGTLTLSTNLGEYRIPVTASLEIPLPRASSGRRIRNLDDFVRLAKDSYDEAFRFFAGKDFVTLLAGEGPKIRALYDALIAVPVTYHRMEEFLIACGRKEPVVVTAESSEASFFNLKESRKEKLSLRKSEWGSVKLEAEVSGSFLELPKTRVVSEDFVGSICEFEYIVHRERLSAGKNFGTITLRSFYSSVTFRVTASREGALEMDRKSVERRGTLRLMREYIDRRLGVSDDNIFRAESLSRLASLKELGGRKIAYSLYEAFVEVMTGHAAAAMTILSGIAAEEFKKEPLELKAAYLYLGEKSGLFEPGAADVAGRIRDWQRRKQESLLLFMIWLRTDPDLARMPVRKLRELENAYERGFRSPLLYLDAAELLRADAKLLVRMTPFAQQVLHFTARNHWLTRDLSRRAAFLAGNAKQFSGKSLRLLESIYGQFAEDEVLEAICKLLIKGSPLQEDYFRWYERAVERDIHVTRLYEYFVETMPEDYQRILPAGVLRYFLLVDTLSDHRKAMLYANIIRNREKDRETYESYRPKMEAFAAMAAANGRENRHFAVICQEFIRKLPEGRAGESLLRGLFAERIFTDDPRIRKVVVRHMGLSAEEIVPVNRGEAYIHRYTKDAVVLLTDGKTHRYFNAVEYSAEPLMARDALLADAEAADYNLPGLWLYVTAPEGRLLPATEATAAVLLRILQSTAFTPRFRRAAERRFFVYLDKCREDDRFDAFLSSYDGSLPGIADGLPDNPSFVAGILAQRGFFRNAFLLLRRIGFEQTDPSLLAKVADDRIAQTGDQPDEDTLRIAEAVFRAGQPDAAALEYLCRYFDGPLDELQKVRQMACDAGVETAALDGRILRRAVLTGRRLPELGKSLGHYAAAGGERATLEAFLNFEARLCFGGSVPICDEAAVLIASAVDEGKNQELIRKLSLLYYYAKKPRLSLFEENVADKILEECALNDIRFSFFKELPKALVLQYHLEDRAFVEFRAAPEDLVILHYRLGRPGDTGEEREEPMKEMHAGIFSKEFILFYGETLTWYVTVHRDGEEKRRTRERSLTMANVDMDGRSRYQLINQMLRADEKGDREELLERIRDFRQAERMVERLFVPVCAQEAEKKA